MFKKTLVLFGIIILLLGTVLVAPVNAEQQKADTEPQAGENFTHNVLLELFVTTWCGYCPSSEDVAKTLNGVYGENFVFATMVTDDDEHGGNGKAQERSDDYQVQAIPDGVFDGGYRREVGGQSDTDTYETAIEESGNRDVVATVDLEVDVVDNGDGTMEVSYSATYLDAFPFFDAHLRVYIVEKVSRWPDKDGHPIPYGFIDYAFDKDVRLTPQLETTETTTWEYDNHENATFDNYVIIAALFDKSSGVERYVVQSATTEEANILIDNVAWDPEYPKTSDEMTFYADVIGSFEKVELEYAFCTQDSCGAPEYIDMELEGEDTYTITVGDFSSDYVSIDFRIVATDSGGNQVRTELIIVEFGQKAPGSGGESKAFYEGAQGAGFLGLLALLAIPLTVRAIDGPRDDDEDHDPGEDYYEEEGYGDQDTDQETDHEMEYQDGHSRDWDQQG